MKLPAEAVEAIIVSMSDRDYDYNPWVDWEWGHYSDIDKRHPFVGLGTIELVDRKTGTEGDYDTDTYLVFRVIYNDGTEQHFRKTGHYTSYAYGETWEKGDFTEVSVKREYVTKYV